MRRFKVNYNNDDPIIKEEKILNPDDQINNLYKKFIEENCIFEPLYISSFNDVNKAFNIYFKNHSIGRFRKDKLINIDNRFSLKNVKKCKYCNQKHNKFCCDDYFVKDRTEILYFINLKLKDVSVIDTEY